MEVRNFLARMNNRTFQTVAFATGLVALTTAGCFVYLRLRRRSNPAAERPHPAAHDIVMVLKDPEDEPGVLQPSKAGELKSTVHNFQFLTGDSYCSQSESVVNRRCFLCLVRGSEVQLWIFSITDISRVNHLGFTYYTSKELSFTEIQVVHGKVMELISCCRLDTFVNVPQEDCVQTFHDVTRTYLSVWPDGQMDSHQWMEEETFCTCDWDSEILSDSEDSEEILFPEEMEVPFISSYLANCGVTDVYLKLQALREAFSILFSSIHTQYLLFVAGKNLVKHLAAADKQDAVKVQLAFESLIHFLRSPSNQEVIRAELLEAELRHLNFIDIFYELIFFGWFINNWSPKILGAGFLEKLYLMLRMWDTESWEPAAEKFFSLVASQFLIFLKILFSQPLDLYSDPAALPPVVLNLLKQQVQVMMKTVQGN